MPEAYRTPDRLRARIALHERYGGGQEDLHRWLFSLVMAPPDARVLEVGCGTARLWTMNAERVPPGWRLTLTDLSAGMVAAASEALSDAGLSGEALVADVQELPFADAAFDLAFANHMLYHVPDLPRALDELSRVLKPGGLLVAATNGEAHLAGLRELPAALRDVVEVQGVDPLGFTLESGGGPLAERFGSVEVLRRDDVMSVDDAEVLLAYLRSMIYVPDAPASDVTRRLAEFEERVRERLAEGPLRVQRSTGAFLAR